MSSSTYATLGLSLVLALAATPALGAPVVEDSAVLNGGFELAAHHVRPALCEVFGDGAVDVFEPGNPLGLPWLIGVTPCHQSAVTAAHWSHGAGALYEDFDGDGDREAKILPGVVDQRIGSHNMWQAYPSPHQAWTAGFRSYEFTVESGVVPTGAAVQLSLSETPVSDVSPWAGYFLDCSLTLRASAFTVVDGVYSIDPTAGLFASRWSGCDDEKAAWDAATTAEQKRAVLAKLRIVQNSFWSFNTGSAPVVIDDVKILGAPLAAETLAANAANGQLPGGPSL